MANAEELIANLQQDPQNTVALDELERLLSSDERWGELSEQLDEFAREQPNPLDKARFLLRHAHVLRHHLDDSERANDLVEEAMDEPLSGEQFCTAIDGAFAPDEDWQGLNSCLIDALDFTEDKAIRSRLLHHMGRTYEDRLFERERAITCYQKAFKEDPSFRDPLDAARAIYRLTESWPTVVKLYKVEIKMTGDDERRAQLFTELGDLYRGQLEDNNTALTYYRRALDAMPEYAEAREHLEALEETLGGGAAGVILSDTLVAEETQVDAPSEEFSEAFGESPQAQGASSQAPVVEPLATGIDITPIADSVDSREYAEHLISQGEARSDRERYELIQRGIRRLLDIGGDTDEAVLRMTEALLDADDGVLAFRTLYPAFVSFEPLWLEVAEQLNENGASGEARYAVAFYGEQDAEKAQGLRSEAGIWGEMDAAALEFAEMGNWRKALNALKEFYEHLGDSSATDIAAYGAQTWVALGLGEQEKAIDSLRRVLRKRKDDRDTRSLLSALYAATEKWTALVDILKRDVDDISATDPQQKVLHYRSMAKIYRDELNQDVMVVNAYRSLLELDPSDEQAMDELIALLRDMKRYPDLVDVLRLKADAASDPNDELAIQLEVADIFETSFTNQNEAMVAWEAVAALDPQHRKALARLNELYERRREWEKLLDVRRRLFNLDGTEDGLHWLKESAHLCATRMREPERAADFWREILEYSPSDLEALQALEQIHERAKDWESLADVLERRAEMIEDESERAQAYLKLGQIFGDRLKDSERALPAWQNLLALQPDNFRARESVKKSYIELEDWDSLEAFFAQDGSWADYVRQIESLAGQTSDRDAEVELLHRAVRVWTEELETPERATRDLEKILEIEPGNGRAAMQLIPLYETRNDYRKLPDVLQIALAQTEAPEDRFELLRKLASIEIQNTREYESGLEHIGDALSIEPTDAESIELAEQAASRSESWSHLAELYGFSRDALYSSGDETRWLELTRKHARLLESELQRTDDALSAWEEILEHLPTDEEALAARERVFRANGDWGSLLAVLRARRQGAEEATEQIELLEEIAQIEIERREDRWAAVDAYLQILEIDSANEDALHALREIYEAEAEWDAYVDVSKRLLNRREGTARTSLELDIAAALMDQLSREGESVDYLAAVVDRDSSNEDARMRIERLVQSDTERVRAASLLEPLYESDKDWTNFVEVLDIQAAAAPDKPQRVSFRSRAGRVREKELSAWPEAFETWADVLRDEPSNEEATDALERVSDAGGLWSDLVEVSEEVMMTLPQGGDDSELAVAYGHRIASYQEAYLEDPDAAIATHQRVLDFAPSSEVSRKALLGRLLEDAGRWQELVERIESEITIGDDASARRDLRFRAARIYEERIEEPDSALRMMQQVLEAEPRDVEALDEMDRLYGVTGDSHARTEVLRMRLELEPNTASEDALSIRNRLADLTEFELDSPRAAIELREGILLDSPSNTGAREALRRLLSDGDHSAKAAEVLEPIYLEEENWEELASLLRIRLAGTSEPTARRTVALELDEILTEHLEDARSGLDVLEQLTEEVPGDREVNRRLIRHADRLEAHEEVAMLLQERASDVFEPEIVQDMLVSAARLQEEKVGNAEGAVECWRQLLEIQPQNSEALAALERLYEQAGNFEELTAIIERRYELAIQEQSSDANDYAFRAAEVLERELGRREEAVDFLQRIIAREPANHRALDELMRLYEEAGEWQSLVDTIDQKATQLESIADIRELRLHAANILVEKLEEPERAAQEYQALLLAKPDDIEVLDSVIALNRRTERWTELLRDLERKVELVDGEAAIDVRFQMASLRERELGDMKSAMDQYEAIIAESPEHAETMMALEDMIGRGDEVERATGVLLPVYGSAEMWNDVIRLNGVRAEAVFEPAQRRALFARNADLFDGEFEDLGSSFVARTSALREEITREDVDKASSVVDRGDFHLEWAELLAELREEALEPALRQELTERLARVREDRLEDISGATDAWTLLSDEQPEHGKALENLERLHELSGNAEALNDVLRRRIDLASDPEAQIDLRLKRATVMLESLDEPLSAISEYRAVLSQDETNDEAVASLEVMARSGIETRDIAATLEPLYRGQERWDSLIELYRTRIDQEDVSDERFAMWKQIAEVHRNKLEDPLGEMDALGKALSIQPRDPAILDRLEELAEEHEQWDVVADLYSETLNDDIDEDARLELSRRVAMIASRKLNDDHAAERAWKTVLQQDSEDADALAALDAIYERNENWEELASILGRRREHTFEPQKAAELGHRHAQLLSDQLDRPQESIDVWNQVLEVSPEDTSAMVALEGLYELQGQHVELFDVLDRRTMITPDPAERTELVRRQARLAQHELERPDEATDLWRRVYDDDSNDWEALSELASLYEDGEQSHELVTILRQQADLEEDPARETELRRKLGSLYSDVLGNDMEAVGAWERARVLDATDSEALIALRELYERTGQDEKLAANLETQLRDGIVDESDEIVTYEQLGEIYGDRLGRADDAIRCWNEVVARDESHLEALDRLEALYVQKNDGPALVGVLERKVPVQESDGARIDLWRRIATIWTESSPDQEKSMRAWEEVVNLDIEDQQAGVALDSIYREREDWEALAGLQLDQLDVVEDPWERRTLLRKAAALYRDQLEKPEFAYLMMQKALTESPLDEDVRREVDELAAESDSYENLAETYHELISKVAEEDGEDAILPLLISAAHIRDEQLSDLTMAEAYYDRALMIDSENAEALDNLESIYRRTEDWEMLVRILRKRAELSFEPAQQVELLKEAGRLQENRLEDLEAATATFREALDIDETDEDASFAVERLLEQRGEWEELVEALDRRASMTFEPSEITPIRFRIGGILRDEIDDSDRAIEAFRDVLMSNPQHIDSLDALEELYGRNNMWEDYIDLMESRSQVESDASDSLVKQAQIYESALEDIDSAIGAYERVLSMDAANETALGELRRIYEEQDRPFELAQTLERQAMNSTDAATQIDAYVELAKVSSDRLEDHARALQALESALEIDPADEAALEMAAALYEQNENWTEAIARWDRLAEAASAPEEQQKALFASGRLLLDTKGDTAEAELRYRQILDRDAESLEALDAIYEICVAEERWEEAVKVMRDRIEYTTDLTERSSAMARIAAVYEGALDQREEAQRLYEEALEMDPTNIQAAEPYADLCMQEERWERARPLYELLINEKAEAVEPAVVAGWYAQQGRASVQLAFNEDAERSFESALEYDPGRSDALSSLAGIYTKRERYDEAFDLYMDLVNVRQDAGAGPAELAELYFQAGSVRQAEADGLSAQQMFEQALATDPSHIEALRGLAEVTDVELDPVTAVDVRRRLLAHVSDDSKRFEIYVEIAEAEALMGNVDGSVSGYRSALEIDPKSKIVLAKLLNIFRDTGNWQRATEVLAMLASLEEEPQRKARLLLAIGAMFRDQLENPEKALQMFNQSLDEDPTYLEAFEAIDGMLTRENDWKAMEMAYHKMLKRIQNDPNQDSLRKYLLQNLGEIYRSRLDDDVKALQAFNAAAGIDPSDQALLEKIAALYQASGERGSEVIAQHRKLLAISPLRTESHRVLFESYLEEQNYDSAWCMAAALKVLGDANGEENTFYSQQLNKVSSQPNSTLTKRDWKLLYHPSLDQEMSRIFGVIATNVKPFASDIRDYNLHKRKDKLNPKEQTPALRALSRAINFEGLPEPLLYSKRDYTGFRNANTDPVAILVGGDMMQARPDRELNFEAAKTIALMRPEFYCASALRSSDHLKTVFAAALAVHTGQIVGTQNVDEAQAIAGEILRLPEPVQVQLREAVKDLIEKGQNPNVSRWLRAVDHTASRVGMLMSGDPVTAVRMIDDETNTIGKADATEKKQELVKFAISEEYFELRQRLGLGL